MKGEINKDFYCVRYDITDGGFENKPEPCATCKEVCERGLVYMPYKQAKALYAGYEYCKHRYRKWPTLEQFCQEYHEEVPQGMPVWVNFDIAGLNTSDWVLTKIATEFLSTDRKVYYGQFRAHKVNAIVVACTPWGKPLSDWRPE